MAFSHVSAGEQKQGFLLMTSSTKKTKTDFFWILFGTAGQNALQFISLVVLARLLSPEDFGIVAAAMIVVGLTNIFSQLGIGPAVVQKKELTKSDIGTAKTLSALIGLVVFALVFASAELLQSLMNVDGLAEIIRLLSFVLIVSGLTVVGQSLLQRHFEFKKYIVCIFVSQAVSSLGTAIPLAMLGFGFYSLVYASLVQSLTLLMLVSFLTKRYGGWSFNLTSTKQLANYGFGQSLGKICNYFAGQGDNFVVVRQMGVVDLGFYSRAYSLVLIPANLVGGVLDKISFPIMARKQDDNSSLAEMFVLSNSIIAMLTVPMAVFIMVSSDLIVDLLFGRNWSEVAPILSILVSILFFRTAYKVSDSLSKAKGSVYKRAWRQAIFALAVFCFSYIGSFYGVEGVAYGVAAAIILNYVLMLHLSKSLVNFAYKDIIELLIKYTIVFFVVTATIHLIKKHLFGFVILDLIILAFATLVVSLLCYYIMKFWFKAEVMFLKKNLVGK